NRLSPSMTNPRLMVPMTATATQTISSLSPPRRSPLRSADASSADSANDSRRSSNAVSSPHRSVICRFSDSSAPAGIPLSLIVGLVVDDLGQVECADDVEAQAVADLACRKAQFAGRDCSSGRGCAKSDRDDLAAVSE